MYRKILSFTASVLVLCLFSLGSAHAQTGSLSGVVTDATSGEELIGATVLITELGRGAPTNLSGEYRVTDIPVGTYNVRFSYVGFRSQTIEITISAGENTYNAELRADATGREEVIVTGIASRTSREISEVAVSRVNAADFTQNVSFQDLSQLIGGRVAGVGVQPSGGTVGAGVRFNVRSGAGLGGDGQPIIFVDGIRIDNSQIAGPGRGGQGTGTLADINMDEVETIDILKGPAAAALYGTSGSNGVVLITTKRGQALGDQGGLSVNVRHTRGFSEFARESQTSQFLSERSINEVFREGLLEQYSVNASGGSEFIRFYTSFDQRLEEGILPRNYMDRQSFRANFDAFPREDLTLGVSAGYTLNEIALPDNDNNVIGYLGNVILAQGGDDGTFGFTAEEAINAIEDVSRQQRFLGSVSLQYRPIEGLELNASVGYDGGNLRRDETIPPGFFVTGPGTAGQRYIFTRINEQYTFDLNARYSYEIVDGLTASSVLGTQMFDRTLRTNFTQKRGFSTPLISNIGAGEDFINGNEGFLNNREAGIFFEQNFNFNNQYMLSIGGRQDFASSIGDEAPNIFYPKASFAVRVDNIVDLPAEIDFLKFRVAYGETGQLPEFNDGASRLWAATNSAYGTGGIINFVGNPDIKPERVRELELGVEFDFLNRFGLDLTYYRQWAEDSIIDFRQAPSTGVINLVPFNVGGVEGQGLETTLSINAYESRDFSLDFDIAYSFQESEVTDLGGAQPLFDGFSVQVLREGTARSAFFLPRVNGALLDENGLYAGVDVDEDPSEIGSPFPRHTGSFAMNFRAFRNLNVYALVDWAADLYVYNNTREFAIIFRNDREFEELRELLGLGSPFVDGIEPLTPGTEEYNDAADRYARLQTAFPANQVERADWLKLRELSVSYNFTEMLRRTDVGNYINSLRLSAGGRNLLTSTMYSGLDPEVNFDGARSLIRGQDFLTMPPSRQFFFTVSLGF
ncbi:MAG: TonB-dependent receptor [Balneolales bacterium]|nr:TonB-dependent receptor [Balneolales bacterium]